MMQTAGMPAILVTGGAGYIGSHACKAMARAGFLPVSYDNLSRGHADFVKWGPLEIGDISDRDRLAAVMDRYKPVAVLHFAALAYVGESVASPELYYRNNVAGTLALVEVMLKAGIDKIVLSSTCATYGIPRSIPITEDSRQTPINPYGASKLMIERILPDLSAAHALRWVALRYFNACGADPDLDIGERHDPEPHLIPQVLMAAAGLLPYVEIFGTDYPTPDGTAIRDFVHVSDLAAGHIKAVTYLLRGGVSQAFNLGTGSGFSVRDVIAAAEAVTGRAVPVREADRRPGDPPVLVADPRKARDQLNFLTSYTSLPDIVRTAWNWHRLDWRVSSRARSDGGTDTRQLALHAGGGQRL